jgi:signal recognition particle subunit SRP54
MGPLQGVMKMIPGMREQLDGVDVDEARLRRVEAIVRSMTPHERAVPHVIDGKRRQRIAHGSGTTVEDVNQLLEGRKQMERMMKQMGKGKLPAMPGQAPAAVPGRSATRKPSSTRKRKKKSRRR